jgi:hypothetical protein
MLNKKWFLAPLLLLYSLITFSNTARNIENRDISDEYFIIIDNKSTNEKSKNYINNLEDMRELEHGIINAGGVVLNKYYLVFTGIHARLSDQALAQIETIVSIQRIQPNELAYLISEPSIEPMAVQSWGLDRIDQRDLPLNSTYNTPTGDTTAHAYIIDSGIRTTHAEFTGRIGDGTSTIGDASIEDCLGHGTHVSGTVLGTSTGVFTNAIVHPVRVFGCGGTTTFDAILKGLEWVIANHKKPAVANMSLGANTTVDLLDVAVRNTVASGVTVVVAAGNSNQDACTSTPAREPTAITIAASDSTDKRASFSNFGACVDLFAPGVAITSSYYTGDNTYASLSGTSMASPHVCGAAALVSSQHPTWTPKQVSDEIVAKATVGKITDPRAAPNKLLYVSGFVNDSLLVDAGADIITTVLNNDVILIGSAKSATGTIIEGKWRQMSGPQVMGETTAASDIEFRMTLKSLPLGSYVFRLTASDSAGRTAFDEMSVTVKPPNQAPVADAGVDVKINPIGTANDDTQATLDSSGSIDPDGSITTYSWEVIDGDTRKITIENPDAALTSLKAWAPGLYTIRLTVTDAEGLSGSDDMLVTVNNAPTANAGSDLEVSSTEALFLLNGSASDADGDSIYLMWFQIGGPNRASLNNFSDTSASVTGFIKGSYTFRLFAVDSSKSVSYDDIVVTVK